MKIRKIDHVHLVVRDFDKTLKAFERILGLTPWELMGINDTQQMRQTILTPPDGARIEIVQPKSEKDRYASLLKKNGDGVYGLSIFIDDFDEEVKKLKAKGVKLEEETFTDLPFPLRLAWVPPSEGQGVWLELVDAQVLPDFEKDWESTK